ncbi:hypothetical protein [Longimicrobium sp.]|jgi:hypothetical protein|uniref:hypothetical protein n=1 Tax=Longimicrobium sp. TaxID=2029185 RepID=UPI002F92742B
MTEKPMMPERPCGACGEGTMRPADVSGFVMEHRDDPRVRVGEQLVLPVCDICGDMALNAADTDALEAALERSYRRKRLRQQRALINDLRRGGLTQVQIERFASLSPGYLSKLRNGKLASGATFRLLYLLHQLRGVAVRAVSRIDPRLRDVSAR